MQNDVDLLFYISSLGISLNKGIPKNRSFWSLGHFWAFCQRKENKSVAHNQHFLEKMLFLNHILFGNLLA